jgi:GNAT superfamily N-acetyltransferase
MLVRPVRAADVAALVPLYTEWGHPQPAAVIAAQLTEWEQTPLADVVVAELSGEVVGVVAVCAAPHLGRPGRFARVMGLVVASTHRRHRVGAALMQAAEDRAREWGCDRLELTSSRSRRAAHAFYSALGYEDQSQYQARYLSQL